MKLMEKMECVNGESANEKPKPVGSFTEEGVVRKSC
jgi:hypothetical protein